MKTEYLIDKYNLSSQSDRYLFYYEDMVAVIPSLVSSLAIQEKEKFRSMKSRKGAFYYLFRKGMVRLVLSQYASKEPANITIMRDEFQKPYLPDKKVAFNLSHSGEYLYIGISHKGELGVDIESKKAFEKRSKTLLEDIYSDEERAIYSTLQEKEQEEFFRRIWVRKEAVVKALGMGITVNLSDITVMTSESGKKTAISVFGKQIELYSEWNKKYYLSTAQII